MFLTSISDDLYPPSMGVDPLICMYGSFGPQHLCVNSSMFRLALVNALWNFPLSRHRVQLVRRVVQEPLVRGSNPSGARVQWIEGC
jgi:hypothetical protein